MVYHAVSSPPCMSLSGTTSSPDKRSPRQEERQTSVPPHLAQPALDQEPMHGFPDMPFGDPTPRGGKAPGKRRGSLWRVPPLAAQQQQKAFVHHTDGRS